jgi:hypothetical protein
VKYGWFLIVSDSFDEKINTVYEKVNTLYEDFQQFRTEMRHEAARQKTKIQEMLIILREKFPRNEQNDEVIMDLLPEFPLKSIEEYIIFNQSLKNDEAIRKCFVSTILEHFSEILIMNSIGRP